MSAGRYSFTIEQGATLEFEIQYKNPQGEAIDLTDYTGFMQIRSGFSGSAGSVTYLTLSSSLSENPTKEVNNTFLSFSGSNLSTPPTSGSIGVYAGWQVTQELTFTGDAYYDLEITSGSIRTRILEGLVQLDPQVTQ